MGIVFWIFIWLFCVGGCGVVVEDEGGEFVGFFGVEEGILGGYVFGGDVVFDGGEYLEGCVVVNLCCID